MYSSLAPKQIYEETLRHEFLPRHTTEIFKKWQTNNPQFKVYDIKAGKEAKKGVFYISWDNYKENKDKVQFKMVR